MERYEYKNENSNKFWGVHLKGNILKIRFGKIGTSGQTYTKKYSSPSKAQIEYHKLVCEKLAKGYKPTQETAETFFQDVAPTANPKAIGSLYIGEHVPYGVVRDICGWATACIQHKMTPKQFKSVWRKFMEQKDEKFVEALSRTSSEIGEFWSEFWLDETEWGEGDLDELYAKAVKNDGDKFIWFDNNAYIDIVALCGNPGARAIEICVLTEEYCKNEEGQWLNDWPAKLGPGCPIAWMSCDDVTLHDETVIEGG